MSQASIVIATTATLVAFLLGRLTTWPAIRRLRAQLAEALWWLAHDPLTGLLNRTGLHAVHADLAPITPQPIVAVLLDLDQFKHLNDTHGHDTGDDLLIAIGDRIADVADIYGGAAARLSGDEYAAVLPVRGHDLDRIADTFITLIAQPVHLTTDHGTTTVTVTVTASLGVAVVDSSDPFEDIALHRADIAMYHAKHHGGNQHAVYQPGMTMPDTTPRRGPRLRDLRQQHRDVIA